MSKKQEPKTEDTPNIEEELEKLRSSKLQLMADFENFRKRTEADKAKFGAMANKMLLENLMEVVDDISLASKDDEMTVERAQEMLHLLSEKLAAVIAQNDIEKISVKQGDPFNPALMEAITVVPVDAELDGKVVEVISAGYKYRNSDELIRNAKVIVGKQG